MKQQVKIPPMVAEGIALCYQSMQAAVEYARSVYTDPDCPQMVRNDFVSIAASVRFPLERIDKRIPKQAYEKFREQIKENDSLRLENIKSLYSRMVVEQQEIVESFCENLLKGKIEYVEK